MTLNLTLDIDLTLSRSASRLHDARRRRKQRQLAAGAPVDDGPHVDGTGQRERHDVLRAGTVPDACELRDACAKEGGIVGVSGDQRACIGRLVWAQLGSLLP